MRRDYDLVRRILADTAESRHELEASLFINDRHSYQDVADHMKMMEEAGLIRTREQRTDYGWYYMASTGVTWDGYEFLASASNEAVWCKVKLEVAKKVGSVPFPVLCELLNKTVASMLGLRGAAWKSAITFTRPS